MCFIQPKPLATWYLLFHFGIQHRRRFTAQRAGHRDRHVGADLDLLYDSIRAVPPNSSAVVFGHFDNEAVVAALPWEALLEVSSGSGELHGAVLRWAESPGHAAQRGGEAGGQQRHRQMDCGIWAVLELPTLWQESRYIKSETWFSLYLPQ